MICIPVEMQPRRFPDPRRKKTCAKLLAALARDLWYILGYQTKASWCASQQCVDGGLAASSGCYLVLWQELYTQQRSLLSCDVRQITSKGHTSSGSPAARSMLEQTLLGIVSPRMVTTGRPAHRASPRKLGGEGSQVVPADVCAL